MTDLRPLIDEVLAFWWRINPIHATVAGVHEHDGELVRFDEASRTERVRQLREYIGALESTAPAGTAEELDHALLSANLRWDLIEWESVRPFRNNPGVYLEGPLAALHLMALRSYAPPIERARRATERLAALPRLFDEARESLSDPAPILADTAIRVARSAVPLLEEVLPVYLGAALREDPLWFPRWESALRSARAALLDLANWLETEAMPHARGEFALGERVFSERLRLLHGITDSPAELRAFGSRLKGAVEAALAEAASEIDPSRPWQEVAESLKDEHPAREELVGAYAYEMERARRFVEERGLVSMPPGETLDVVATPEHLRPVIPYAAYQPPAPFEAEQKGFFYVTPPPAELPDALRDHSVHGIPVTALHEAYPGHHLQLVWSNRTDSDVRRIFWTSVFAEGWALYCEEMMWEQGFYTDPRQRLLQLKDLLWRACRVVVDIGLHTEGWDPQRAVDYMVREAGLELPNAEVEVRRYCAEPTQPLSYAVGKREMLRLRRRYFGATGRRNGTRAEALREFHDRLLRWGTIPPALVARGMGLDAS